MASPTRNPVSIAVRKWNPMKIRDSAFSRAAFDNRVKCRSTGCASVHVLPAGNV